jgi:hypothetical protein
MHFSIDSVIGAFLIGAISLKLVLGYYLVCLLALAPFSVVLYWLVSWRAIHGHDRALQWTRGLLAWNIVAFHAHFDSRYTPVARLRLFIALNLGVAAIIASVLRPDLHISIMLVSTMLFLALLTHSVARRHGRARKPHYSQLLG